MSLDAWFQQIRQRYQAQMRCGKGCTACCYGLFDISLADAVEVARGFQSLTADQQRQVRDRAERLHGQISDTARQRPRPMLFAADDPWIDRIVEAVPDPPCPLLGEQGQCLIYAHRPLACRLEGVPMVDVRDGLFGDWCELNFQHGVPAEAQMDLKQDYDSIDEIDEARSFAVAQQAGIRDHRAVTLIPSVIAEYETFWKSLLRSQNLP